MSSSAFTKPLEYEQTAWWFRDPQTGRPRDNCTLLRSPETQRLRHHIIAAAKVWPAPVENLDASFIDFGTEAEDLYWTDWTDEGEEVEKDRARLKEKAMEAMRNPLLTHVEFGSDHGHRSARMAECLEYFAGNPNIRKITAQGFVGSDLECLRGNRFITHIDLENYYVNRYDEQGVEVLATMPNLEYLRLWECSVEPRDAEALAASKSLKTLDIYHSYLYDEGTIPLAKTTSITALYIGSNRISTLSLDALAKNTVIKDLRVGNHVWDENTKYVDVQEYFISTGNTTLEKLDGVPRAQWGEVKGADYW